MSSPTPTPRRLLFLLSSARENGNAEQLARKAAEALPPGTRVEWVKLEALQGEPFREPEFFQALLRIWLGPVPADWKLKDSLLGR